MRNRLFERLTCIARREAGPALAEDVVQDAMLIALESGRLDLSDAETARWLCGVVRNRARMVARSARRRRQREGAWQSGLGSELLPEPIALRDILDGLSPALRTLAALVLTGHNRREIAWLLHLPDTALRQRISALRRQLAARNLVVPTELTGLCLDLSYGRIRDALLPKLLRHGGAFASHDPDGHLFVVRRSQTDMARQ